MTMSTRRWSLWPNNSPPTTRAGTRPESRFTRPSAGSPPRGGCTPDAPWNAASVRCSTAPYAFEARWAQALKEARVRDFRFHDLRHSCASLLAQSGATLLEIGDVLGHRQLAMTKRYSHLTTGHKAALVNRVLGSIA
jgi:integrase